MATPGRAVTETARGRAWVSRRRRRRGGHAVAGAAGGEGTREEDEDRPVSPHRGSVRRAAAQGSAPHSWTAACDRHRAPTSWRSASRPYRRCRRDRPCRRRGRRRSRPRRGGRRRHCEGGRLGSRRRGWCCRRPCTRPPWRGRPAGRRGSSGGAGGGGVSEASHQRCQPRDGLSTGAPGFFHVMRSSAGLDTLPGMIDDEAAGWIAALGLERGPAGGYVRSHDTPRLRMTYVLWTADSRRLAGGRGRTGEIGL